MKKMMARSPKRPAGVLVVRRSRRTEEEPPPPDRATRCVLSRSGRRRRRHPPPRCDCCWRRRLHGEVRQQDCRRRLQPAARCSQSPEGLSERRQGALETSRVRSCGGLDLVLVPQRSRMLRVRALGGGLPEGERHKPGLGLPGPVEEDVDRRVPVPATTTADKGLSSLSPTGPAPPPAQASHCICRRLAATTRARGGKLGGGFVAATHRCQVLDAPTPLFSSLLSESWYSPQHSRTLSFRPLRPFWGLGTVG